MITASHGTTHGQNLEATMPVMRWRLADGTRLAAAAQPENVTGTPINLTQERLVAHADVEPAKAALLSLLERARTTDQGH